jgi:hypothetical protein
MPLHVSGTCAHHQEVKIALHSLWYHHTYRCDVSSQTTIIQLAAWYSTSFHYAILYYWKK